MACLLHERKDCANSAAFIRMLGVIPALSFCLSIAVMSGSVRANDIVMAPAGCQAPFLYQAEPMRWHEWYLLNPLTNITTWVICPLTYDEDVVTWPAGGSSNVNVYGAIEAGASGTPRCFFGAADRTNTSLPPYIFGSSKAYAQNLGSTVTAPTWRSTGSVSHDNIRTALGGSSAQNWGLTIFCELPPGHAISGINVIQ